MQLPNELMSYHLAVYMQTKANESGSMERFANWYVETLIIPEGNRNTGMQFHKLIKCKNDMSVIYSKLLNTNFVNAT